MPSNGPEDHSLWITRQIGLWESHFFGNLEPTSNCNIVINTCLRTEYLDPAKVELAYKALIYNQPNFRADVIKREEDGGIYFTPATDFSNVFHFIDQSDADDGVTGYTACWDLAEHLANKPFTFGTGSPLHRCYLVKRPDCYILINQYHHGIADGTSGFRVINEILRQYDLIVSGKGADLNPAPVLRSVGEMAQFAQNDEVVDKMIEERVERAKVQKILLPPHWNEVAKSRAKVSFVNRTLSAVGTQKGMQRLRTLCRENEITVGAYSFAVQFFAVAAVHIRRNGGVFPEEGLPTLYTDTVADLRTRLVPCPGDCIMLCIAETWIKAKIEPGTSLLDIAKDIALQLQNCFTEQRFPLFQGSYQDKLKTSPHNQLLSSLPEGSYCDVFPSNQLVFKYPTHYTWGEVSSIHSLGSYWCPSFVNRCLLYHCVNGVMNYSIVCCDGPENIKDTQEVLDLFFEFMECADKVTGSTNVMDFVRCFHC